jgi:hypothetical protein
MFIGTADALFGPITTIRRQGRTIKHIPWTAFKFTMADWERVNDTRTIIAVCHAGSICSQCLCSPHSRMRTVFNSTSRQNNNLLFGAAFLPSKNFRPHGKQSLQHQSISCTRTRFKKGLINLESTIRSLTTNQFMSLRSVSKYISLDVLATVADHLQYSILTTS